MLNKTLRLVMVFLFSSGLTSLHAQIAIPASGGNATGNGTVSYSIGQVVYTVNTNLGSVAQGVQQPYEISVITAIEDAKDISLVFSIYPNPTTDFLKLKVMNYDMENLSYWLYGVNGNLIETRKISAGETQISMTNQLSGSFFLKITEGNKEVKTFKIIKH